MFSSIKHPNFGYYELKLKGKQLTVSDLEDNATKAEVQRLLQQDERLTGHTVWYGAEHTFAFNKTTEIPTLNTAALSLISSNNMVLVRAPGTNPQSFGDLAPQDQPSAINNANLTNAGVIDIEV
jgi:hypothetical protein